MGDGYGRGLLPWMAQGSAEDDDDVQRLVNAADARRAAPRPIVPESIREHEAELGALRAENARLRLELEHRRYAMNTTKIRHNLSLLGWGTLGGILGWALCSGIVAAVKLLAG